MLNEYGLPKYFWTEAVHTACYVSNRVLVRPSLDKTPYELWHGKIPNIGYFKVFGCKCFILNNKEKLGKFDSKTDVGIFLGYSSTSKAYRVFNKKTLVIEESIHVVFDESWNNVSNESICSDDLEKDFGDLLVNDKGKEIVPSMQDVNIIEKKEEGSSSLPKEWRYALSHPKDLILGNPEQGVKTRSSLNLFSNLAFVSQIEPRSLRRTTSGL